MSSVNKAIILGTLGRDPEVRHMQDGKAVANLSIATSERWKDKDGNKQERTEWHRVSMFGGVAEVAEKYLKKGSKVYIEGKIQTRKWTNKEGQDQYTTEIIVDRGGVMQMLGDAGGQQSSGPSKHEQDKQNGYQPQPESKPNQTDDEPFDDDIPF